MAVDAAGTQYVADFDNHTIRKITPGGVVTHVCRPGRGASGARTAPVPPRRSPFPGLSLWMPREPVCRRPGNNTIRKITPAGVVSTLAGADRPGAPTGTGSAARFNVPSGVAVDAAGNVYVADTNNSTIRRVTPAGVVTTLAGNASVRGNADGTGGAASFIGPRALTVDANGTVYVADTGNNLIRQVTPAGVVTTLAGGVGLFGFVDGIGSAARFNSPQSIAVDRLFNLYVADTNNHAIRMIAPGGVVTTVGGRGFSGLSDGGRGDSMFSPTGIAVDAARVLYVGDTN